MENKFLKNLVLQQEKNIDEVEKEIYENENKIKDILNILLFEEEIFEKKASINLFEINRFHQELLRINESLYEELKVRSNNLSNLRNLENYISKKPKEEKEKATKRLSVFVVKKNISYVDYLIKYNKNGNVGDYAPETIGFVLCDHKEQIYWFVSEKYFFENYRLLKGKY